MLQDERTGRQPGLTQPDKLSTQAVARRGQEVVLDIFKTEFLVHGSVFLIDGGQEAELECGVRDLVQNRGTCR